MDLLMIEREIPRLVTVLVLVIIGASFALSYAALVALALDAGIPPLLAPLWPLCLDAFMAVGSLVVLRRELDGLNAMWAWVVVGGITALSVMFNILHAPVHLISQAIYAIPPIVVFCSFEMLLSIVKMDLRKSPEGSSIPDVEAGHDQNTARVDPIVAYYREHAGAKLTDIGRLLGVSRSTATRRVNALVTAGLLVRENGVIRVVEV